MTDATLLRIHIASKKLTALYFPDFDVSPLPRLARRVKVEFQAFNVVVIDHAANGKVKLLYLRSEYLSSAHPHFELQKQFDEEVKAIEDFDLSGEGPDLRTFSSELVRAGIQIPQLPSFTITS